MLSHFTHIASLRATVLLGCLALLLSLAQPILAQCSSTFLFKFGSQGGGTGQFRNPYGVAVDSVGNIVVADYNNHRIQKFSSTGIHLLTFGGLGTADGLLTLPSGVAVDSADNIIVADSDNARIQKFSSTGTHLLTFGVGGTGNGEFDFPVGVAVDAANNIYVTDTGNSRIQKFSSTGTHLLTFGSQGSANGQFESPNGIATDIGGNIYVADTGNNRIQKFSSTGTHLLTLGTFGLANGQFNQPYGVAVDAVGNIVVTDYNNQRIQIFNSMGMHLLSFGSNGTGNGQFRFPQGVAVNAAGNIIVAEQNNHRIQVFGGCPQFAAPMLNVQAGGNPLGVGLNDPAVCLDPGGLVGVAATLSNPNNVALAATFTATLPAGLTAITGTCSADVNPGGCAIAANGGLVSWNGTLAAGQTVTIIYRARIGATVAQGAQLCIDNTGTLAGVAANLPYCFNVTCPTPINARVSDQKAGSVLVFPYYTSTIGGASDTRLTISNISNAASVVANTAYVHLFFIEGTSCQQSDLYLCLTPNASFSFKASDYDPGNTGYLIAVVVNNQGVPIQNNVLIGNAFVNTPDFADNYGAEAFRGNSFAVATNDGNSATLYFDQVGYDAAPKQFTTEIQSPLNATGQQIVTAGLSGSLVNSTMSGAAQVGTGLVYNGNEKPFGSFNAWLTGACQAKATISTTSPRVPNGMAVMVPSGQAGTLRFSVGAAVGLLLTPRTATWKGIRTLHKTQTVATTLTIPIFVPVC